MGGFDQECPAKPAIPDDKTLRLRGRLEVEEPLEFLAACGLAVDVVTAEGLLRLGNFFPASGIDSPQPVGSYTIVPNGKEPDIVEAMDGLADTSVVTHGAALAFGVDLEPIIRIVDANNLLKIMTGHKDPVTGKFIKAENHPSPYAEIAAEIERQRNL